MQGQKCDGAFNYNECKVIKEKVKGHRHIVREIQYSYKAWR